ncbi:hypothetical protein ACHHRT_05025 [Desulfurivibrio sp. D14AmB]|uniref:hypothetical protein n=1 Tax=Desulfurivibrio sp. D14AmB TaxID=3374370 RepID=UPI00376EFC94
MTEQRSGDRDDWLARMPQVAAEVMENTAFSEVRQAPDEPRYDQQAGAVSLEVLEPTGGQFSLLIDRGLLTSLTRLVYALPDEEITPAMADDLLAELLNTIAGRFLAEVLPPEQGFSLGIPRIEPGPGPAPPCPALRWDLTVDNLPFTLLFCHSSP